MWNRYVCRNSFVVATFLMNSHRHTHIEQLTDFKWKGTVSINAVNLHANTHFKHFFVFIYSHYSDHRDKAISFALYFVPWINIRITNATTLFIPLKNQVTWARITFILKKSCYFTNISFHFYSPSGDWSFLSAKCCASVVYVRIKAYFDLLFFH